MHVRRITAAGVATALAAGLTILMPSLASATTGPACDVGGPTGYLNNYTYTCVYTVAGNPHLTWRGAPITSGQGTGLIHGTCVGGLLPYYQSVQWAGKGGGMDSGTPVMNCGGPR